jgi:predicted RND superfamily exporter protein
MIEASEPGAFLEPENLDQVAQIQAWLEQQPEIGGTTSMVDYLRVLHQAFRDGQPGERRLPDTRKLAAQLLLIGANEELDDLVDRPHRTATILVRSSATSSRDFDRLGSRIDERLALLPSHLNARATGNAMLLTRVSDTISRGQALSLVAACGMIGAILCLYFRSVRTGLLALVPNVLPVAFYFGVMGATGITLNNATALMGSIVLGIAVDDTIHFLVHFRRAAKRLGDRTRAAAETLAQVGRPVTYTTVAICLGLGIVATSALETQAHFGALGALTLAFAWAVDVVFTPALCSTLRVEGPDPEGTP